jgi:hypothetical protein
MNRRLITNYSTLTWSDDGRTVTKSRSASADSRRRYRNELRVNQLLNDGLPPLSTPRLLDHDTHSRSLTFEAVEGAPLGPKYPTVIGVHTIDAIAGLACALTTFDPHRRWMRRLNVERRLRLAGRFGLLTPGELRQLTDLAGSGNPRLHFAHGDLTARNVMEDETGPVLIDWEWGGLYPPDYDLAFLWFSLVDVDGGRDRVERHVVGDPRPFLLAALIIQLWHLQWFVTADFRARHVATRDHLIDRLLDG